MTTTKKLTLLLFAIFLSGCQLIPWTKPSPTSIQLTDPKISIITPSPTIINTPELTPTTMSTPSAKVSKATAVIKTSEGNIKVILFPDKAPKTVENFVGLAKGTKEWTDPKTGQKVTRPLYQNVIFHRVIKDFMIQGGDPLGTGRGDPGYRFADEPVTDEYLRGTLAMANAGPNTNGSQFFIVHKDYPLPKLYTIFGRIDASDTASLAVLDKIATTPVNSDDRPLKDVVISAINIIEE
ncbi:MAG: Peptidyl-prolyl cis-trans isomerase [Candidatus Collierbacteria bacterium GW2011_GWB1_44_197]|nr:MAG: Peptidyl-prolyl cis-trans isomerase [Candidatus Collierbacteria bacterium GW2011_GWB1_44_197]